VKAGSDSKRKSTYGCKAHINVGEDGLIKSTNDTAGNVHDSFCLSVFLSFCLTILLSGEESAAYADSAYCSGSHGEWLATRNIESRLIKRAYRNKR
jgi:IS5 family transposase